MFKEYMCGVMMAQCLNVMRHRFFACPGKNLFSKNITKRLKSEQNVLSTENANVFSKNESGEKAPMYKRIAGEKGLDLSGILTKQQNQDEVENIFQEIAQGDAEIEKQLRLLLYEVVIKREEGELVPCVIEKRHWEELLKLPTLSKRNKYLSFLYMTEKKKESGKIKDALRKKEKESFENVHKESPHIYYGLGGYSMFLRIYSQTLAPLQDIRALTNKLFAPPILFDCSYEEYMNKLNIRNCAKQIALSVQLNRAHPYPCTLQLVNLKKDDLLMEYLQFCMPNLQQAPPFEIHENSHLDMYPKKRLVYLTPHTSHFLDELKPDDIYIIGAYVDKGEGIQASLAKAKEQGLRMAKLPLDKYLLWRKGTKSLTLNNVLNILLDFRFYKNWQKALQSIPNRNITG